MVSPLSALRLTPVERTKAMLLSGWFFLTTMTLWLLKPVRQAWLLAHLGPAELPYVRFGAVLAVTVVVMLYTRLLDRVTRLQVAAGASTIFATLLVAVWIALRAAGPALGNQTWFVWALFILVDVYSTVMIGIFWTYTNDIVSRVEADKLYGPIGLGGILGGVVGGGTVDLFVELVGQTDMLLVCVALVLMTAVLAWLTELYVRPPPRPLARTEPTAMAAFEGLRLVARSRYLLLIVIVVVSYEFAAAMTDFAVSVVLSNHYADQRELARMFGRIGWVVSSVALVSQLVIVPLVLPRKRLALLLPPIAMGIATVGFAMVPIVAMAVLMSASDRGLNYSVQQSTKETLYVPLGDAEKYKAKAFIDMLVDRAGKALSSLALMGAIALCGVSIAVALGIAAAAVLAWSGSAVSLGRAYATKVASREEEPAAPPDEGAG